LWVENPAAINEATDREYQLASRLPLLVAKNALRCR